MSHDNEFFANLRELGVLFGATNHEAGDWLFKMGLRTRNKKGDKVPSSAAFEGGFVRQADNGRGGYHYVWHRKKTVEALLKAGHRLVMPQQTTDQPIPSRLFGPFERRSSGGDMFEIVSGDGAVVVWVRGDRNADAVLKLLDLAFRHGSLN